MGAFKQKTPTELYNEEQQQEFFLLDESHIVWKFVVPIVTGIIGFILSTGIING